MSYQSPSYPDYSSSPNQYLQSPSRVGSLGDGGKVKHRSAVACQSCRSAKTRCKIDAYSTTCRRCAAASIPCSIPTSRRGRIKGSKNRSTIEKLLSRSEVVFKKVSVATTSPGQPVQPPLSLDSVPNTSTGEFPAVNSSTRESKTLIEDASYEILSQSMPKMQQTAKDTAKRSEQWESEPQASGIITPLDPHNLIEGLGREFSKSSERRPRTLLHLLAEQFPIGEEKFSVEQNETNEPQDPLLSIAKIAKRGWNVNDEHVEQRVRHVPVLSTIDLPPEDAQLLEQWTPATLQRVTNETTRYFKYTLRGSKRDVARYLDPLQRNIITEPRGKELFKAFWKLVHPQWAMLDPSIHSLDYVRSHSALLTTTILSLGSIALATLPERSDEQVDEAIKLHTHTEKLNLVVYSTGARSIEIVQAQILLSRFSISSRSRLDEQRWIRSAMIPRMAAEIGLPFSRRAQAETSSSQAKARRWNELRTRAFMVLSEYRFFTFSGRAPIDLTHFELDENELEEIDNIDIEHSSSSLLALYHLYLFQREMYRRLGCIAPSSGNDLQLEADFNWVGSYTENWITKWCSQEIDARLRWHLLHDALSSQLLLSAQIIKKFAPPMVPRYQELLLKIALRIFEEAVIAPHAFHMTHRASIFPFAGAIILRLNDQRDLVLRVALRMAGHPQKKYVPTFVRSAGNQLLTMLCANPIKSHTRGVERQEKNISVLRDHIRTSDYGLSRIDLEQQPITRHTSDFDVRTWPQPITDYSGGNENASDFGGMLNFDTSFDFPFTPDSMSSIPVQYSNCSVDVEAFHEGSSLESQQVLGFLSDVESINQRNRIGPDLSTLSTAIHQPILPYTDSIGTETLRSELPVKPNVPLSVNTNLSSNGNVQALGREAYLQTIYATIGRLLQTASSC